MAEPLELRADGTMVVRLGSVEADAIAGVALEVAEAGAGEPDESTRRLFPVAFPDDASAQAEFERMTRDEQVAARTRAARAVLDSIERGERRRGRWTGVLGPDEQQAWLTTINAARLVLGTRLDVTEEMDHEPLPASDPRAPAHNLYLYLSGLLELLTEALLDRIDAGER